MNSLVFLFKNLKSPLSYKAGSNVLKMAVAKKSTAGVQPTVEKAFDTTNYNFIAPDPLHSLFVEESLNLAEKLRSLEGKPLPLSAQDQEDMKNEAIKELRKDGLEGITPSDIPKNYTIGVDFPL